LNGAVIGLLLDKPSRTGDKVLLTEARLLAQLRIGLCKASDDLLNRQPVVSRKAQTLEESRLRAADWVLRRKKIIAIFASSTTALSAPGILIHFRFVVGLDVVWEARGNSR
jgi:hypothetical protein